MKPFPSASRLCGGMLWAHRQWGRRTTCSGTGEETAWTRETSFARMRSSALGKVWTTHVCALITSYFLAPWVTWWLLISRCGDPALTKMCCSYLAQLPCLHACVRVCGGEVFGSICAASPVLLWLSVFSSLSCVTQRVVLCCVPSGLLNSGAPEASSCVRALPGSGR